MFKKTILPLTALVLCTVLLLLACSSLIARVYSETRNLRSGTMRPAVSYEEVLAAILSARKERSAGDGIYFETSAEAPAPAPTAPAASDMAMVNEGKAVYGDDRSASYSTTNIQVEGVDEADLIKTDGEYIYALYDNELRIYRAAGAESALLSRASLLPGDGGDVNRDAREMYLWDGTAAVVCQEYDWSEDGGGSRTVLRLIDVSDPEKPVLRSELGQDGYYVDSRMTEGTVYLVSQKGLWYYGPIEDPVTVIPCVYTDGVKTPLAPQRIFLPEDTTDENFTVLTSTDLSAGAQTDACTVLGSASTVYMTPNSIYLAATFYDEEESDPYQEAQYSVVDHVSSRSTTLSAFDLTDGLTLRATGAVPGSLLNQFSLDEKDGNLRLAVTEYTYRYRIFTDEKYGFVNYQQDEDAQSDTNSLYVLDGGLNVIGSLTGLGEDEQIYSVRFDGDLCYFVTFRQTDPLFAADLSDPSAPRLLSELKLPGFSSYLHIYGEGLLFGLGRWADEETGWSEEIKLAMYDSSDPAALTELASYRLPEDAWYTPALNDHKALLIRPEKNLIGFAADRGYYLFAYEDGAFVQKALLTDGWEREDWYWDCWNTRALYIDEALYLLDEQGLRVYDLNSFEPLCSLYAY